MRYSDKKIVYLTAGAGGMFCGSCMHDNALAKALSDQGWDIQLVPTYTPIRTDESDFSVDHVLFGGINVYLQQKIPLLRHVPSVLDRFLDSPWLIRKVTSRAIETDAKMLGKLALSMLKGSKGNQRKEVAKVCKWLGLSKPDVIIFSNALIGGCIEDIKKKMDVPVLVTLQGDDVFLDSLNEPFKTKCIEQIKQISHHVDGFVVQSEFFRGYMSEYFAIEPEKIYVTPLGLDMSDFKEFLHPDVQLENEAPVAVNPEITIGYMARLAKEKGLHHLVDGFIELRSRPGNEHVKLQIAGWISPENKEYIAAQWEKLDNSGLSKEYRYLGAIEREEKIAFYKQIDILSVPTDFLEPKGLYALEAMASGVPVALPAHGAFPELIEQSGGGVLFKPRDRKELANAWQQLIGDEDLRAKLGDQGQQYVHEFRNAAAMAVSTSQLIKRFVERAV
ncbi:MAG: glycosyltransferase family 4 protein [Mariniblastus sp.]|nr:glycosyltransferase family 4 protein [Mariniblastus sp.]